MDILLLFIGVICIIVGLAGSFLPIIPGPLTSWMGLLAIYYTSVIPTDWSFLGWTLAIALFIMILDYIIPAIGTKALGGSKAGIKGSTIGLIIGIFFMPFGIVLGPFIGAFVGELTKTPNKKLAFKAALGSFLGFLTGTIIKFIASFVYLLFFAPKAWKAFSQII